MTLNEKIEHVRDLLTRRDDIDRELEELLGDGRKPLIIPKKAITPTPATPAKPPKGAKVCKNCGRPGHMAKTCDRAANAPEKSEGTAKLSQDQYAELRDAMHDREFMSAKYSLTRKLPPREVNAAVRSTDYEDYLSSR